MQKVWVQSVLNIMPLRPSRSSRPIAHVPAGRYFDAYLTWWSDFRSSCYTIVHAPAFDNLMSVVVFANLCFMATAHARQTAFYDDLDSNSNIVFTCVLADHHPICLLRCLASFCACRVLFGLEAALKISALGPRCYFSSKWLSFELIIVVVSVVTAVLDVGRLGNLIRLVRVIKVLRVARVAPSLQVRMGPLLLSPHLRPPFLSFSRVQRIIRTFVVAVPPMLNVLCFLGLVFFVYTVTSIVIVIVYAAHL